MISNVTNDKIMGSLLRCFLAAAVLVVVVTPPSCWWYPEVAATVEDCPAVVSTLLPPSIRNELEITFVGMHKRVRKVFTLFSHLVLEQQYLLNFSLCSYLFSATFL